MLPPFSSLLLGLALAAAVQAEITSPADRTAVYGRAGRVFEDAILLKPRCAGAETNPECALAPLLLQELAETNSIAWPEVVWFETGETSIYGKPHRQLAYWWEVNRLDGSAAAKQQRGIRITLNSRGAPVIWEVLNDHSGGRVIFVAQSLEAAALALHGAALPGRRFAVEQAVAAAPAVVIARVIENSPAVMGPMVHLDARGRVATVICRCMTAQTRVVSGNSYYDLRPGRKVQRVKLPALEVVLRLPPEF